MRHGKPCIADYKCQIMTWSDLLICGFACLFLKWRCKLLAKLTMELNVPQELGFNVNKSSLFHGVLMEKVDEEYAKRLHENRMNPFSIYLERKSEGHFFTIATYSKEAYTEIIERFMSSEFNSFKLKHNEGALIKIKNKVLTTKNKSELMDEFYDKEADRYFNICFKTPTAFKMHGQYIFYPDIELIYRNIMNKYNTSTEGVDVYDDETLEYLLKGSRITRYNLKSVLFHMEGVRIPAFVGNITIKIDGTATMRNFARMLFRYSEYSGIGIKCSLGMGAVELRKDDGR